MPRIGPEKNSSPRPIHGEIGPIVGGMISLLWPLLLDYASLNPNLHSFSGFTPSNGKLFPKWEVERNAFSQNALKYLNSADFFVPLALPYFAIACVYFISHFHKHFSAHTNPHTLAHTTKDATCQVLLHFMLAFCTIFCCFRPVGAGSGAECVCRLVCVFICWWKFRYTFWFLLRGREPTEKCDLEATAKQWKLVLLLCLLSQTLFCGWALGGGFLLPAMLLLLYLFGSWRGVGANTQPLHHPKPPTTSSFCCWWRQVLSHKIQNVNTGTSLVPAARTRLYSKRKLLPIWIFRGEQLPQDFTNMLQTITWACERNSGDERSQSYFSSLSAIISLVSPLACWLGIC